MRARRPMRFVGAVHQWWCKIPRLPAQLTLIPLVAGIAYANTLAGDFHYDDIPYIVANARIRDLENFSDLAGSRYVTFLTFALNYRFGGLNVFGYHLTNLIIHVANGLLVYTLVRLVHRAAYADLRGSLAVDHAANLGVHMAGRKAATIASLFFVSHPIQTQAVTYIVQRFASLAALFYLLAVVQYLMWRAPQAGKWTRPLWYAGSLAATIIGMKTKEHAFTLPFALLLVEMTIVVRRRTPWVALIPFFLTLLIIPFSRIDAVSEPGTGFARETDTIARTDYLFTELRVIVTYLRLLAFPVGQNLDYEYPIYHTLLEPAVSFSALLLIGLAGLACYLVRPSELTPQRRLAGFGLLWFFLTLSVESSIFPILGVISEHRVYLPSFGIFLAAATTCASALSHTRCGPKGRLGFGACLAGVLAVLTYTTCERNKVWQDEVTLWQDVARKSPDKPRAFNNLGLAYMQKGNLAKAQQHFEHALRLDPRYARAHINLGSIFQSKGRTSDAIHQFETAIAIKDAFPAAHNNLGLIHQQRGQLAESLREFQAALRLSPGHVGVRNNLANTYQFQGKLDEAINVYEDALRIDPASAEVLIGLGSAYQRQGRFDEAIGAYRRALLTDPTSRPARYNLAFAYQQLDRWADALREYKALVRLDPDDVAALFRMGEIHQRQGRLTDAAAAYAQALQRQPDFAAARSALRRLEPGGKQ